MLVAKAPLTTFAFIKKTEIKSQVSNLLNGTDSQSTGKPDMVAQYCSKATDFAIHDSKPSKGIDIAISRSHYE